MTIARSNRPAREDNLPIEAKFRNRVGSAPKRLLVTGFGPFPGMARNPSGEIARRVAASPRWRRIGIEPALLILDTSYAAIRSDLEPALRDAGFAGVLMVGVAGRSKHIRVEARAVNRANVLMPDAAKRYPGARLGPGPTQRVTSVNPQGVTALLKRARLACRTSQDAGHYLCNAAYFAALGEGIPVLFLHIPKPPRRSRSRLARTSIRQGWEARIGAAFIDVGMELIRQGTRA